MELMLELTMRGSAAAVAVIFFDRAFAGRMSSPARRLWWCFVPIAFLIPLRFRILPPLAPLPDQLRSWSGILPSSPPSAALATQPTSAHGFLVLGLWLAGALGYLALVAIQTARASRRWSRERLSTDHALLELLEDCKAETGITAPIGLVISNSVPSPAILGWLRPRILLPDSLIKATPSSELRPILLHELAHFRWFDVPFNWLLTLVRAIHWFNPFAHLGAVSWVRFREEAADEAAVKWMRDDSGQAYAHALVHTLRRTQGAAVPFGALAIVESLQNLKKRITMITRYPDKSPRLAVATAVSLLLGVLVCGRSVHATESAATDPKVAAAASAQSWTKEIDDGKYEQSWQDASAYFQSHVTAEKWVGALTTTRTPLGKCLSRKQVSASYTKNPQTPTGVVMGELVAIQFESSFENMKHVVETLGFVKEADGTWKSTGYLLQP